MGNIPPLKDENQVDVTTVAKILIVCQRKEDSSDPKLKAVNDALEKYALSFFRGQQPEKNISIEYLTHLVPYGRTARADYAFKFGDNQATRDFVETHRKEYSLIILQTCPFIILAEDEAVVSSLSQILRDDGILVATAIMDSNKDVPSKANIAKTVLKEYPPSRAFDSKTFKKYFSFVEDEKGDVIFVNG